MFEMFTNVCLQFLKFLNICPIVNLDDLRSTVAQRLSVRFETEESLVLGSSRLDGGLSRFILCLVFIQPRKTGNLPDMTEKLLSGT